MTWAGDVPKISMAPGEIPFSELRLAEMRRELEAVERYMRDVRLQAASGEPADLAPPHPGDRDAEDLPPGRRPGSPSED